LSFHFGIVAIIDAAVGRNRRIFDMLCVCGDRALLDYCLVFVRNVLRDERNYEANFDMDCSEAIILLRESFVMNIITKLVLLPLILCWFPDIEDSDKVYMNSYAQEKSYAKGKEKSCVIAVYIYQIDMGVSGKVLDVKPAIPNAGVIDYCFGTR
jgi:hypothetical protein